jgi:hypothetical protein
MFSLAIKESLDRKFKRLRAKDKEMLRLIAFLIHQLFNLVNPVPNCIHYPHELELRTKKAPNQPDGQ